jgi:hypothetical protein
LSNLVRYFFSFSLFNVSIPRVEDFDKNKKLMTF